MTIEVANSLIVGQTNTPLDARTRIATLADVSTVANPFVGMRVYVLDEAKSYIVKSLKDKLIGAYTVPDAQIDTVEPLNAELNLPMLFALPRTLEGDPALHFAIEFHETDDYSGTVVYSIDTAVSQTGVKVFDGTVWVPFPADGAGTIFYGNQIKIEYNEAMGGAPKNVRYKLYLKDDDPTAQPWKYTAYPAVGGAGGGSDGADPILFDELTPEQIAAITGPQGKSTYQEWLDLGNEGSPAVFLQSLEGAAGTLDSVITIVNGNWYIDDVDTGVQAQGATGSVTAIVSDTEPSSPADGTIWIKE